MRQGCRQIIHGEWKSDTISLTTDYRQPRIPRMSKLDKSNMRQAALMPADGDYCRHDALYSLGARQVSVTIGLMNTQEKFYVF